MSPRRRKLPTLKAGEATAFLAQDPTFGPWVEAVGPMRMRRVKEAPFDYLVRSIVFQQLAGAAAYTIHGRCVEALRGKVTPRAIASASDEKLRGAGLSRGKLAAIRDLAAKASSLKLDELPWADDDEVVRRLTTVRGIGPCTAHMYLMFALRRPDVWPCGDLGVRAGYARIHGLAETPGEKEISPLGEAYRPWRSAAAWYCWQSLETEL